MEQFPRGAGGDEPAMRCVQAGPVVDESAARPGYATEDRDWLRMKKSKHLVEDTRWALPD